MIVIIVLIRIIVTYLMKIFMKTVKWTFFCKNRIHVVSPNLLAKSEIEFTGGNIVILDAICLQSNKTKS